METRPVRSQTLWIVSLGAAGLVDCSLAMYHSILPYHMGWTQAVVGMPDSLVWALFALNFSWSVIVFLAGCLVLYAATLRPVAGKFAKLTVFTIGLFWLMHGAYTWLHPFPLPAELRWLSMVFIAFPVVAIALHWMPLLVYRQRSA
ncbi:MAG TPA: hypothetical protein VHZ01_07800 [Casimicrobiaceae bacterium]|jgi:hypothetical protein|nr:hypothetical protein [Casimicrobiaceae bacterium]